MPSVTVVLVLLILQTQIEPGDQVYDDVAAVIRNAGLQPECYKIQDVFEDPYADAFPDTNGTAEFHFVATPLACAERAGLRVFTKGRPQVWWLHGPGGYTAQQQRVLKASLAVAGFDDDISEFRFLVKEREHEFEVTPRRPGKPVAEGGKPRKLHGGIRMILEKGSLRVIRHNLRRPLGPPPEGDSD